MTTIALTSQTIINQATESARALLSQGWEGGGSRYDLGTYHGDAEALAEKLGREPTRDERLSLEHQIRAQLDAAAVDHTPKPKGPGLADAIALDAAADARDEDAR